MKVSQGGSADEDRLYRRGMALGGVGVPRRDFEAGETVLSPGRSDNLYRLESGLIRLHVLDADDARGEILRSLTLRYVKPGAYFGEEALTGGERWYLADAVTRCSVSILSPNELSASDRSALETSLAASIDGLGRALRRLARKPLRARVAAEVLELADSELATRGADGATVVAMTHDDLAASVGSVRETITKVVGDLVRLGAVRAGYGKLIVRDEHVLREVAGE